MNEWAFYKIISSIGGAVGTLAVIVAKKNVNKIEAYSIVLAGILFSFLLPTILAKSVILRYGLVNDFDTMLGLVGVFGLVSGIIGFALVGGIYKIGLLFEKNPLPFLTKFIGLFGKDK